MCVYESTYVRVSMSPLGSSAEIYAAENLSSLIIEENITY